MKRLLFLGIGSALMFTMGGVGPAQADAGPHTSTIVGAGQTATMTQAGGNRCASCHRAHTAKAADYLLKQAQPALCYSCHGTVGAGSSLDVVDGASRTNGAALRGGGFQYALLDGTGASKTLGTTPSSHGGYAVTSESVPALNTAPVAVTSNHQIDGVATGTMWGNGVISSFIDPGKASVTLECGSCHDPHGNGNYRILRAIPNDAGTQAADILIPYAAAYTDSSGTAHAEVPQVLRSTTGVNIPDAIAKNYTTNNYWDVTDRQVPVLHAVTANSSIGVVGVAAVAPTATQTDGYVANIAAWCTTCHTRYYANSGSAGVASGDAVFTYRHASNKSDKAGVSRPNCIQCHVSHGSNVKMTNEAATDVGFPGGALTDTGNAVTPSADSRLLRVDNRGTCVMCHNV